MEYNLDALKLLYQMKIQSLYVLPSKTGPQNRFYGKQLLESAVLAR